MANDSLIEVFDQCVTRLANGASIDDCVRRYPQYQNELRVMLEVTRIPHRAQVSSDEVAQSQARVALRFEQALTQTMPRHRPYLLQRVASMILFLLFVGSLLTSGVLVIAQDSIPGDTLYGIKRLSEQARLFVASDKMALQDTFDQRRIEETKQVIKLRREVDVQFVGIIDAVSESAIDVSGLVIEVSEPIQTVNFMAGMRVDVVARTRSDQILLATDIRILDLSAPQPEATITPIVTPPIASTATTRADDVRPTASETPIFRDRSATPTQPILEESATPRPTSTPTQTRSDVLATESPTASNECEVSPPSDWIRYTIQAGDTPLGIAIGTDISLEQFFEVNCDLNPRLILVGDVVFVPYEPRLLATPTALQEPTVALSDVTIQPPTDEPIDVRPTPTPERRDDKPPKQRDRDGDEQQDGDGR